MSEIQKQELTSMNIAEEQLRKLKELFPEAFTEGLKVDLDKLRLTLGQSIDVGKERYGMNWPGKADCFKTIQQPSIATLIPAREESVDFDKTENLFIEGDNLEVLKLLQKSYLGKVDAISIDPPYNTGEDFIYNDDFSNSITSYLSFTGQVDDEGNSFSINKETNGRFHSDWLNMMYPRIFLAKNLLKDNGIVFINIDDNEVHNLRKLCDEIFGEENFIEIFNWVKTETPANLSKKSKKNIEYILCYQKNKSDIKFTGIKKESQSSNGLLNQSNKLGILKFPANTVETNIPNGVISKGMYGTDSYDVELIEDTEVLDNKFVKDVVLRAKFKWTQTNLEKELENGTIIKIPTIRFSPSYEKLEYDAEVPPNLINSKVGVGTNENAGTDLVELIGKKVFDFPKPVSLIKYILKFDNQGNGIYLDFFSGSGTLAQAIFELNLEDSGNRKFICVQLPEPIKVKPSDKEEQKKVKQNAVEFLNSLSRPHLISEISKERIRKVIKKIRDKNQNDSSLFKVDIKSQDLGFKVFKLSKSNFKIWDSTLEKEPEVIQAKLFEHIQHISPEAEQEAILYELLLKSGFELTTHIEKLTLAGLTVFSIAEGQLLICLEKELTHDCIKAMAEMQPTRVICLDEGFKGENADALKTNAVQIMKSKGVVNFRTV
ncbi:MAG: putative methyltransferase [Bacteroidetes bacterium ADurb.Bin141]|nr:MAG: putative methyltransferase [Bacteroidetes bacterium ADurb.Bin141]